MQCLSPPWCMNGYGWIKVAEHSFQVLMPNLTLLLNYLSFGASFLQESRLTTKVFILAFWLGCVAVAMATELIKNKAYKMFFVYLKISSC